MFCIKCGKEVGDGSFCMHCGHKVGDLVINRRRESNSDIFDKILFVKGDIIDKQELALARFNATSIATCILAIIFIMVGLYISFTGNQYDEEEMLLAKQIGFNGIGIIVLTLAFNKLRQSISMIGVLLLNLISDASIIINSGEYEIFPVLILTIYFCLILLFTRTIKDLPKSDNKKLIYFFNGLLCAIALFIFIGLYSILSH